VSSLVEKRTFYGIIVLLVALLLIVSTLTAFYYLQFNQASSENQTYVQQLKAFDVKYVSDIVIDYGNGTHMWFNTTKVVQPGWNLYTATLAITNGNVNATCCEYGSHFVSGIGGVQNTKTEYWWLWTYDASNATAPWQIAQVGPDEITMSNNSIYAWTFCGTTAAYNPTCTPL
jgi:hypothetical protein